MRPQTSSVGGYEERKILILKPRVLSAERGLGTAMCKRIHFAALNSALMRA
jgi:hypothetical protein